MRTLPSLDTLLGGLTIEAFLENYWQKKPLLIRGAISGYTSPITSDDLLRIACEDDAEARLILEKDGDYPWQLLYGPFEENFDDMPESHWTLLVQEVNRYVPEIAGLLDYFRFLPSWRIDDIMVSFATKEGGVGAHIDNYDVFLLQAMGQRRWQIMTDPIEDESIVPDLDVRMLQHFEPDEDWVLAPGDMLYLPPRIAHKGVALDDCMTFSVGFRAPSHAEILSSFLGYVAEQMDPNLRYGDPDLSLTNHPARIEAQTISRVRTVIQNALSEDAPIDDWFGRFVTEPRRDHYAYPLEEPLDASAVAEILNDGGRLARNAGTTFAYVQKNNETATLFAGGFAFPFAPPFIDAVPILCESNQLSVQTLGPYLQNLSFLEILTDMINEGVFELA